MKYPDTVILVFAKAPEMGKVNTRLIPDIGEHAATQLQHDLIHLRLKSLSESSLADVILYCSPDVNHDVFVACANAYGIRLKTQKGNDLGKRMLNGIEDNLIQYEKVIVLGTDAPALNSNQIEDAIKRLRKGCDVVFVPAEDGGYVLGGFGELYPELFENIEWGSEKVMQQTINKMEQREIKFELCSSCWDVDRYEDYLRYQRQFGND